MDTYKSVVLKHHEVCEPCVYSGKRVLQTFYVLVKQSYIVMTAMMMKEKYTNDSNSCPCDDASLFASTIDSGSRQCKITQTHVAKLIKVRGRRMSRQECCFRSLINIY